MGTVQELGNDDVYPLVRAGEEEGYLRYFTAPFKPYHQDTDIALFSTASPSKYLAAHRILTRGELL